MNFISTILIFLHVLNPTFLPSGKSFSREAGEDDVVEGANADAGKHGGDGKRGNRPDDQGSRLSYVV